MWDRWNHCAFIGKVFVTGFASAIWRESSTLGGGRLAGRGERSRYGQLRCLLRRLAGRVAAELGDRVGAAQSARRMAQKDRLVHLTEKDMRDWSRLDRVRLATYRCPA
jgi:hypothetical protein